MFPSFRDQVQSQIPGGLHDRYYLVATVHATLGITAQLLGLYIIAVAGTSLIPKRFRFDNYKPWMRSELALWWIIVFIGIAVYYVWYMAPGTQVSAKTGQHGNRFVVKLNNFTFNPKAVTITAGTTVEWINTQGLHTVHDDQNSFKSGTLTPGHTFTFRFSKPGTYRYRCDFHGTTSGEGMAGTIVVKPP